MQFHDLCWESSVWEVFPTVFKLSTKNNKEHFNLTNIYTQQQQLLQSFTVLHRHCFGWPALCFLCWYGWYIFWLQCPQYSPYCFQNIHGAAHTPHYITHTTHCAALLTRHNMASHFQLSSLHGSLPLPPGTTNLSTLYLLYDLYGGRAKSLSVNTRVLLGTTPSPRPISQSTHTLCWDSLTCCDAHPPCQPRNLQLKRKDTDEWDCWQNENLSFTVTVKETLAR